MTQTFRRLLLQAGALACVAVAHVAAQQPPVPPAGLTLSEAVRVTIDEQPQIDFAREQVIVSQATLQTVAGRFDYRIGGGVDRSYASNPLRDREETLFKVSNSKSEVTRYQGGIDVPLRNGLVLSPFLGVTRQDLSLDQPAANRSTLGLGVVQPLLRGRGLDVVTAEENAARFEVSAASQDLRHTASQSVLRTAIAYWDGVAAVRNLEVVIAAENRARTLVDETRTLIEGGNRPAADMRQVQGNLAERLALRAQVEASLFAARHALGVAMGLPADRILSLPLPSDPFPTVADVLPPVPALLSAAVAARADLEAIRQRERSAQTLIVSARDALKPRLDLNLSFGVTGMAEGIGVPPLITAFGRNFTGPTASASFSYARPLENNSAKGLLARSDAIVRQTRLQIDDLTRNIQSNVAVAQNDLARSAERVRLFREAGGLYLAAVDDERQKMQLGLATIIDLVLVEDRLTRSRLDEISALRTYAQALARLRYETGTLVAGDGTTFAPAPDALITIPAP